MTTSQSPLSRRAHAAVELLLVLAAGLFIYGWKLGDAPLDRTEPHRALVAHQMVTSGQWFIPKLFGEIYLRKPPLIYWVEAVTEKVVGHGDEFVWRLPSAIGSALLAVVLAGWSARWFGPLARLPAGLACLALIPLWEQNRGADIDALNTVASVVTAMVLLEMLYHTPSENRLERKSALWIVGLSLCLAVTLLLKGPGGFPPIVGALIGPSLLLGDWRWIRRPGIWTGLLVGIAIFASYGIAAKSVLHHQGFTTDTGGIREAMQRLVIHKISAVIPAVIAPVTTLLYALPVSGVIVISVMWVRAATNGSAVQDDVDREDDIARRRKVLAILGTIAAALGIWIFAGNDNPRYEYVVLPLLAPLVGAMAVAFQAGDFTTAQQGWLRYVLAVSGGLWTGIAVLLTAVIWHRSTDHVVLAIAAGAALIACFGSVRCWLSSRYKKSGAISLMVVLLALAVPLGERKNLERRKKSARAAAAQLREIVNGQPVGIVSMNRDMPELFYYADLAVRSYGERGLDKLAARPGGQWVVLSQNKTFPEYGTLVAQIPGAFPMGVKRLNMPSASDVVYVGWYDPPPSSPRKLNLQAVPPVGESSDED